MPELLWTHKLSCESTASENSWCFDRPRPPFLNSLFRIPRFTGTCLRQALALFGTNGMSKLSEFMLMISESLFDLSESHNLRDVY